MTVAVQPERPALEITMNRAYRWRGLVNLKANIVVVAIAGEQVTYRYTGEKGPMDDRDYQCSLAMARHNWLPA